MRKYLMGILTILLAVAVAAQTNECFALVEEVSQAIEINCSNLPNNSLCYGYYDVEAEFASPVSFAQPADIVSLDGLLSLRTAPFNQETGRWGIALLQTQASLPNTLPGQSVSILLVGDSQLTTAEVESPFVPAEPIIVTSQINANIRLSPSNEGTVIASVSAGTTLPADAQNNGWYRVVVDEQVGWIAGAVIDAPEGLSELPYYGSESRAPMQAFYFSTGIGQPACENAPNEILIQGVENAVLNITVNGMEISSTGATIGLSNPSEGQMQVSVLEGSVEADGLVIPPNYAATGNLGSGNDFISGSVGGSRQLTQQERDKYENLRDSGISSVFDIPEIVEPVLVPVASPTLISTETSSSDTGSSTGSGTGNTGGDSGGRNGGGGGAEAPQATPTRFTRPPEYSTPTEEAECIQPPCGDEEDK